MFDTVSHHLLPRLVSSPILSVLHMRSRYNSIHPFITSLRLPPLKAPTHAYAMYSINCCTPSIAVPPQHLLLPRWHDREDVKVRIRTLASSSSSSTPDHISILSPVSHSTLTSTLTSLQHTSLSTCLSHPSTTPTCTSTPYRTSRSTLLPSCIAKGKTNHERRYRGLGSRRNGWDKDTSDTSG
jgi:hypothetical protein